MEKLILREKLFVPIKLLDRDDVQQKYSRRVFKENNCARCPYLEERFGENCEECVNYLGIYKLYTKIEIGNGEYYGLPFGNRVRLRKLLPKLKLWRKKGLVKDLRPKPLLKYKWKLTKKLWKYQEQPVIDIVKAGYGQLEAPPRSGKCVIGSTLIFTKGGMHPIKQLFTKKNQKTVILTKEGIKDVAFIYKEKVDKTIKIKTKNGFEIRGTHEHPLLILTDQGKFEWRTLSSIRIGDFLCINRKESLFSTNCFTLSLPVVHHHNTEKLPKYPNKITVPLARLLGYFIANGNLNNAWNNKGPYFGFCTENKKVQRDFIKCLYIVFGIKGKFKKIEGRTSSINFGSAIRDVLAAFDLSFVLSREKHIPKSVLASPQKYVTAFLEAYFSCDSYIPKSADEIELCTASKKLAHELHVLLTNYGIIGRKTTYKSHARNGSGINRTYHSIYINWENKEKFLNTFSLLKSTIFKYRKDTSGNLVPFVGKLFRQVKSKYQCGGGQYKKNGKTYNFLRLCKKPMNHRFPLSPTYKKLEEINLNNLALLSKRLSNRISKIQQYNFKFEKIIYKKEIKRSVTVYDVNVPEGNNFIANGIVSHNTIMMVATAIRLGYKTLIMAHQGELLDQFMDTLKKFTNLKELEERHGKKVAGICRTFEDFKKYDIALCNYQHFISKQNGQKRLLRIRDMFGTVIADEAHRSAAKCYSTVLNNISARHKIACTGTIERKDGLHFLVKEIVGPVKALADVQMLIPSFEFVRTPVQTGRQFNQWIWFTKYLASHKERNDLIVDEAIKYVKQGRSVVIPITFVKHANLLVEQINKKYGKKIAAAFTGSGNTKETRQVMIQAARSGKVKVVIGMRQLIQEGINVPVWSVLLEVMPISNAPKFKQETARVNTPMEGKPKPIIRMFCDDISIARGCMRTCLYQGAYKLGYDISNEDKARFNAYCKGGMPKIATKIGKRF